MVCGRQPSSNVCAVESDSRTTGWRPRLLHGEAMWHDVSEPGSDSWNCRIPHPLTAPPLPVPFKSLTFGGGASKPLTPIFDWFSLWVGVVFAFRGFVLVSSSNSAVVEDRVWCVLEFLVADVHVANRAKTGWVFWSLVLNLFSSVVYMLSVFCFDLLG